MPSLCTPGNTDISCQNTRKLKIHKSYEKVNPAVLHHWCSHNMIHTFYYDCGIGGQNNSWGSDTTMIGRKTYTNSNSKRDWFIILCDKSYTIMCIPLKNDYWNKPASSHHAVILGLSTVPVLCALFVPPPSRWIFSGVYHPGYLYHSIWNAHYTQTCYTVRTSFVSNAYLKREESFYSKQCLSSIMILSIT